MLEVGALIRVIKTRCPTWYPKDFCVTNDLFDPVAKVLLDKEVPEYAVGPVAPVNPAPSKLINQAL
jgi:hypothetical protein